MQCQKESRKIDQEGALASKDLDGLLSENNKLVLELEGRHHDCATITEALAEAVATRNEGEKNVKE